MNIVNVFQFISFINADCFSPKPYIWSVGSNEDICKNLSDSMRPPTFCVFTLKCKKEKMSLIEGHDPAPRLVSQYYCYSKCLCLLQILLIISIPLRYSLLNIFCYMYIRLLQHSGTYTDVSTRIRTSTNVFTHPYM